MSITPVRFQSKNGAYPQHEPVMLSDIASLNTATDIGPKSAYVSTENMLKGCAGVVFDDSDEQVKGVAYQKGDVLVSNIRPYLQKAWLADRYGTCSTDVLCIRPNEGVDSGYLYSLIGRDTFFVYMMQAAKGSKMPRGDKEFTMAFPVSYPTSPEEQQKIAALFTEVDNLISAASDEVSALEEAKKGMMQKIFSQEVRFKRDDGTEYPDWEELIIDDIGDIAMCKRVFKEQTADVGDVPFFKIGTFGGTPDAYISRALYEELKTKYSFPKKGTPLISASGTIGRIVIYNGEDAFYQDSNIVWLEHDESVIDEYLCQFYKYVDWSKLLEGTTIKRLYNKNFLEMEISVPSVPEQQKIADFLSSMDDAIAAAKDELAGYQELKKGLLQQMFA